MPRPIVITKDDFAVAEQLRERGVAADIVLEPMRRSFRRLRWPPSLPPSATATPWCWCSRPITSFEARHSAMPVVARRRLRPKGGS